MNIEHTQVNLGNMHDQDTILADEFEEAQESGLDLDDDGWPIMLGEK